MERGSTGVFALDQIDPFGLLTAGARMAGLGIARVIILGGITAKRDADLSATAQLDEERVLLMGCLMQQRPGHHRQ